MKGRPAYQSSSTLFQLFSNVSSNKNTLFNCVTYKAIRCGRLRGADVRDLGYDCLEML